MRMKNRGEGWRCSRQWRLGQRGGWNIVEMRGLGGPGGLLRDQTALNTWGCTEFGSVVDRRRRTEARQFRNPPGEVTYVSALILCLAGWGEGSIM